MTTIRKADQKDLPAVLEIINQAKRYFASQKIPQWQTGYPEEIDIQEDLDRDGGYVAVENHEVVGYCFIKVMTDHNYDVIEGKWLNDQPYAVMHRTCIHDSCKGRGIAGMFIETACGLCDNVRADTHEKNASMRKMLENHGFIACGTVYMEDGTPRIGYQKIRKGRN